MRVRAGLVMTAAAAAARRSALFGAERLAAGAGARRVRVLDAESAAHQTVDIVDIRAVQIHGTGAVQVHAHALRIENKVALFRRILKRHSILKAGAATAGDENAQS